MAGLAGKQFVVIRVPKPADEADFYARVYDAAVLSAGETSSLVDTGRMVIRVERAESDAEHTRGLRLEVAVDNVNRFAEEVWNRGVKYASRPQNFPDGLRRVSFVSPGEITVTGVGPLKLDSTGAFPSFRPEQ